MESGSFWPRTACAGTALAYSVAGAFGRRFARMGVQPLQIAAGQLICSTLLGEALLVSHMAGLALILIALSAISGRVLPRVGIK